MPTEEETLLQFFTPAQSPKKPLHEVQTDIQNLISSLEKEIQLSREIQKLVDINITNLT